METLEVLGLQTSYVRILHVDDSADWQILVQTQLRQHPTLRIIGCASDGMEAILKADQLQPDLVLLDIEMPRLNGVDAARQIQKVAPGSAILFLSQNTDSELIMEALETGAQGFVLKSEAMRDLLEGIAAVLRGERFLSRELTQGDYWT